MRALQIAVVIALISSQAFAQMATPTGNEVNVSVGSYKYVEPGETSISIHGPKFGAEYTGTLSLSKGRHWFARANVRGTMGHTTYDGWCYPFLITPDSTSPNGYVLDVGDVSPCSESGSKDWYLEARGLFGKDFIGRKWAVSPESGLGVRHLSNGLPDVDGYRTDDYLYLPLGVTARTTVGSHPLSFNFEYDFLFHGWQTTRDSALGGGDLPATPTAPPFTINGFSDVSFHQHGGWAIRASAKYQLSRRFSVEPAYIHWKVSASPVSFETVTFTVNGVSAQEQFGAVEPLNTTNEYSVKFGFRF